MGGLCQSSDERDRSARPRIGRMAATRGTKSHMKADEQVCSFFSTGHSDGLIDSVGRICGGRKGGGGAGEQN